VNQLVTFFLAGKNMVNEDDGDVDESVWAMQLDGISDANLRQIGTVIIWRFWSYPRSIISVLCEYVFYSHIPIIHSGPLRNPNMCIDNGYDKVQNPQVEWMKGSGWTSTMVLPSLKSPLWSSVRAIFVHIPKTAGVSIRDAICRPYDVYTHIQSVALAVVNTTFVMYNAHVFARYYPISQRHKLKTIVRNPYDRLVSAYFWMVAGGFRQNKEYTDIKNRYKSFADWVLNGLEPKHTLWSVDNLVMEPVMLQSLWVTDDNQQLILPRDNIGRYEHLEPDVQRLFNHSTTLSTPLPKINRSKHDNWKLYYSNPLVRQKVSSLYRSDFDLFQYPTTIP
jgi:hypothetical protein